MIASSEVNVLAIFDNKTSNIYISRNIDGIKDDNQKYIEIDFTD